MGKGWGYNSNRRTENQIFLDSLSKVFENDEMKVYSTPKDTLWSGCYLTMRLLFNKNSKKIKLIITGKDMTGHRITPYEKNLSEFKTLTNIKKEILEYILDEVDCKILGVKVGKNKYNHIVNLADKEFTELLSKFIDKDMYKMDKVKKEKMWITFYNDMLDRTATYSNDDIVLIHESYIKACQANKIN